MRVHDAADVRERLVQLHMRRRVGGGIQRALHRFARADIDEHDVLRAQHVVFDAARLDRHDTALAVDTADIAPCECDEMVCR